MYLSTHTNSISAVNTEARDVMDAALEAILTLKFGEAGRAAWQWGHVDLHYRESMTLLKIARAATLAEAMEIAPGDPGAV
jgi:hypothetical protein